MTVLIEAGAFLATPQKPPEPVIQPLIWVLGAFKYIGMIVGITMLTWCAGWVWLQDSGRIPDWVTADHGRVQRRLPLVFFGGILVTCAGGLAWWVLA